MPFAAALLVIILCLLSERVQDAVRRRLQPWTGMLLAAAALAALFCAGAAWYGVLSVPLTAIILAYTLAPVALIRVTELGAILALWLPLEFAVGATLVPRPVQGTLHAIAYGIAVTLALLLFLVHRGFPGMKYRMPRQAADFRNAALGFAIAAVILIPVGLAIGFLPPPQSPSGSPATWILRASLIFAGTALPEEILFRALIQNWFIQRLKGSKAAIPVAALIFGLAHLNNGPAPFPNWRYAIVGTLAGLIFGTVFQRSTSVVASALVHTAVNTTKHLFF